MVLSRKFQVIVDVIDRVSGTRLDFVGRSTDDVKFPVTLICFCFAVLSAAWKKGLFP